MVKHNLLKIMNIHSSDMLNFVYIVMFVFETALENAKLAILERLELQIENFPIFFKSQDIIYNCRQLKGAVIQSFDFLLYR